MYAHTPQYCDTVEVYCVYYLIKVEKKRKQPKDRLNDKGAGLSARKNCQFNVELVWQGREEGNVVCFFIYLVLLGCNYPH